MTHPRGLSPILLCVAFSLFPAWAEAASHSPGRGGSLGVGLAILSSPLPSYLSLSGSLQLGQHIRPIFAYGSVPGAPTGANSTIVHGGVRFTNLFRTTNGGIQPFLGFGYSHMQDSTALQSNLTAPSFGVERRGFPEIWMGVERVFSTGIYVSMGLEVLTLQKRAKPVSDAASPVFDKANDLWHSGNGLIILSPFVYAAGAGMYLGVFGFELGLRF